MKTIIIGVVSGVAAAAILFTANPASAQASSLDAWVQTVNHELDRSMIIPQSGESGTVTATFELGTDGRAKDIRIAPAPSGLARAARATLQRVRGLPPLPAEYADKRIRMQMLVGDQSDVFGFYRTRAAMIASANRHNVELARLQAAEGVKVAAVDPR